MMPQERAKARQASSIFVYPLGLAVDHRLRYIRAGSSWMAVSWHETNNVTHLARIVQEVSSEATMYSTKSSSYRMFRPSK
jgi:hypothetical protein